MNNRVRSAAERVAERKERELAAQEPGFVAKPVEPCDGCEEKKEKKEKAKRVSKQSDEQSNQ